MVDGRGDIEVWLTVWRAAFQLWKHNMTKGSKWLKRAKWPMGQKGPKCPEKNNWLKWPKRPKMTTNSCLPIYPCIINFFGTLCAIDIWKFPVVIWDFWSRQSQTSSEKTSRKSTGDWNELRNVQRRPSVANIKKRFRNIGFTWGEALSFPYGPALCLTPLRNKEQHSVEECLCLFFSMCIRILVLV